MMSSRWMPPSRDTRIKGVVMRLGNGALAAAQAEELSDSLQRFRGHGKFVIAQATRFLQLRAWATISPPAPPTRSGCSPKRLQVAGRRAWARFSCAGLFDKIQAVPQMAKRAEYKSAADMYMEKNMTAPDREQLTAVMNSWYDAAVTEVARDAPSRSPRRCSAAFEASPQFAEDAQGARAWWTASAMTMTR